MQNLNLDETFVVIFLNNFLSGVAFFQKFMSSQKSALLT